MPSENLLLEDDSLVTCSAKLLEAGEDGRGGYWILDRTVFHAQGGGQPTDRGRITWAGGSARVDFVAASPEGLQHRLVLEEGEAPAPGTELELEVDGDLRRRHAAVHTAGHLVQSVLEELDPGFRAIKGYHFPDSPYVEFDGLPSRDRSELLGEANELLARLLEGEAPLERRWASAEEVRALGRPLPASREDRLRLVAIEGFPPVPCGGTHLLDLGELAEVRIRKMKPKRGNARASYRCALSS